MSGPSPYLLRVNSGPKISPDLWQQWYVDEHVPDLVFDGKVSTRAALYRATHNFTLGTKSPKADDEKEFLALYQTDHAEVLEQEGYKRLRTTSEMLPGKNIGPNATWDIRNYKMIQNYDPKKIGEVTSPFVLSVEIEPIDDDDYNAWYREEHCGMLEKVPGYRRSRRYQLGEEDSGGRTPKDAPRYLAIHEFDDLDALDGPELRAADASPWTKKNLSTAKKVVVRAFKLVQGFGY